METTLDLLQDLLTSFGREDNWCSVLDRKVLNVLILKSAFQKRSYERKKDIIPQFCEVRGRMIHLEAPGYFIHVLLSNMDEKP